MSQGVAVPMAGISDREPGGARDLERTVRLLEARLDRLERYLGFEAETKPGATSGPTPQESEGAPRSDSAETALEFRIGEFWLARVGILALLLGLFLLLIYPFASLPALVPCLALPA